MTGRVRRARSWGGGLRTLLGATATGLLLAGVATVLAGNPDSAEREAELEELQERIGELRETLEEDREDHDEATSQLQAAEEEVARLGEELRRIERRVRSQEARLEELRAEQADRQEQMADEREALARQIQGAYRTGREEQIKLLLNQEDPAQLGRMLAYYEYLNRARTERIETISEHVERLARLEEQVDGTLEELAEARQEQQTALEAMEATRERREQAVAQLEARLRDRGEELTRLEEDEAELQRLIGSLQDALDDVPSGLHRDRAFSELRGELPWPVDGPPARNFGESRADGRMRWRGMLIRADTGDEVRAVSHGRVAYSGWLKHFGLVLIIEHGEGYLSLYGHNRSVYADVGEWVGAGEVVASVGDSGGQDRSGLYFEIRRGSDPVDPSAWLVRR